MKFDAALEKLIEGTAQANGIDPELAKRVVWQESRGNPKALSHAGAMGLTQLMPGTAKDMGVKDPWNTEQNLNGGFKYLAQQIKDFGLENGVAAYNFGPGNIRKGRSLPLETQNYKKNILGGYSGNGMGVNNMASPPVSIQAPGNQGSLEKLLAMLQPQQPTGGQKIGNILSALAPVAASFHSPQAQAQANAQNMERFAQQDQSQKSRVEQLLTMAKLSQADKPDNTDDMKEYSAAQRQGYTGTFFDYMQAIKRPPGESDPAIQDLTRMLTDKMKKKMSGGDSGSGGGDQIINL